MSEKVRVFVYGTLRNGERAHHVIRDCSGLFLGETAVRGINLYAVDRASFPAACYDEDGSVKGEVYKINGDALEMLDLYEGVPKLYRREEVESEYGDVFVYIWNGGAQHVLRCEFDKWPRERA